MALKIIVQHLKETWDIVLVLNISQEIKIDFYLDPKFSVVYGLDKATDKECVNIRNWYYINVADCPVL